MRSLSRCHLGTCGASTCLHGHCTDSQTCACDEEWRFPLRDTQIPRRVLQRAMRVPVELQRTRSLRRVGVSRRPHRSDGECQCLWGFFGERCNQTCSRDTCSGHGECVAKGEKATRLLSRSLRVRRGLPGRSLPAGASTAATEDDDDAAGAGAAGAGVRTGGGVAAAERGRERGE